MFSCEYSYPGLGDLLVTLDFRDSKSSVRQMSWMAFSSCFFHPPLRLDFYPTGRQTHGPRTALKHYTRWGIKTAS